MKVMLSAVALMLVNIMVFVHAADEPTAMMTPDQDDQTMKVPSGHAGFAPIGIITNTIDAKNNNVLVSKSNVVISMHDRVQLAHTIKEMMSSNPDATMATEDIIGILSNAAKNPAALSNAAGIVSDAQSGSTGALAGHVVGLLDAAFPSPAPASDVVTPATV